MTENSSIDLSHLPPLRQVIEEFELQPKKSLGQNFLLDLNITRKIVRLAGVRPGQTIIEVGPGPGGLTRALLESPAKKIIALEKDGRAIAALKQLVDVSQGRLDVREADATKVDYTKICDEPTAIIANLPYNVGTELLLGWLHQLQHLSSLTLMFQREVAQRLGAAVGGDAYGRISVLTQILCDVKILMTLPPGAFTPPPKVHSSVVHLVPRKDRPHDTTIKKLETITAAAFGQRRKTIGNSLGKIFTTDQLLELGYNPKLRAENLSPHDFLKLAEKL